MSSNNRKKYKVIKLTDNNMIVALLAQQIELNSNKMQADTIGCTVLFL